MTSARHDRRHHQARRITAAALLATASWAALLAGMPDAAAQDCTGHAAPPSDLATPSMLYETLRARTNAQLLAIGFMRKPVERSCAWIYEVKVLTASGSVVELDFDADDLNLVDARGPDDDRDTAALVETFGGNTAVVTPGTARSGSGGKNAGTASNSGKGSTGGSNGPGGGDDGGSGEGGSGEGGEGGNSGSGSNGSGGGDSSGSGGEGGEGGSSGSGGGEGGDSGGEGGEGGNSGSGGEGGDD